MLFLFFLVNINHIQMHMFIQNYHWDVYVFKTEKVKMLILSLSSIDFLEKSHNRLISTRRQKILVVGNCHKALKSVYKEKWLCENNPVKFQFCYCQPVFEHLIPHLLEESDWTDWCL